jgi:hypothetical protein
MEKYKKTLQELILNALSLKKARKQEDIIENIEVILREYEEERIVKPKYLINRALKKMIDDDIIMEHETEQSSFLSLTSSGRQKLRTIKLNADNHLVSTTWDGYWRVIIVDIPEARKKDQDAIRYILKKAQFIQIKSSVWISPFPMEHMMINIKNDMELEENILVMVTNKLDPWTEHLLARKFEEAQTQDNKKNKINLA